MNRAKPAPDQIEPVRPNPAILNLYQKLAAITGEIGTISKGGKNREQGYQFIEYAAVAGVLRTLFAKYNVMRIPTMGEREESEVTTAKGVKGYHVLIHFTFTFINGDVPDEREAINWIGEATDYGDKATNKAATAALKYCLMRTFNVSEKSDEDADEHTPAEIVESRPKTTTYATPKQIDWMRNEARRVSGMEHNEDVDAWLARPEVLAIPPQKVPVFKVKDAVDRIHAIAEAENKAGQQAEDELLDTAVVTGQDIAAIDQGKLPY